MTIGQQVPDMDQPLELTWSSEEEAAQADTVVATDITAAGTSPAKTSAPKKKQHDFTPKNEQPESATPTLIAGREDDHEDTGTHGDMDYEVADEDVWGR